MGRVLLYGCATWMLATGIACAQTQASRDDTPAQPVQPTPAAAGLNPVNPGDRVWQTQPGPLPAANRPGSNAVILDNPTTVDTAQLTSGTVTVSLHGLQGLRGDAAQQLSSHLAGQHLTCQPDAGQDGFVCLLPDGTDVAQIALLNGAAIAGPDAPDAYQSSQKQAQDARRGVWSDISRLPPETMPQPVVQDTDTLVSNQMSVQLDGIQGLGQPYAAQLQDYIATNGNRVICLPQAAPARYICVTNDATDIATIALANGAAIALDGASAAYHAQQADAMANHRGIWAYAPDGAPVTYTYVVGDAGVDGITYVDGVPWAWIDGSYVALAFVGGVWGYYDYSHGWHAAPATYASHMERFHPGGAGIRGYGGAGAAGVHTAAATGHGAVAAHPGGFAEHPGAYGGHPGAYGGHPGGFAARPGGAADPRGREGAAYAHAGGARTVGRTAGAGPAHASAAAAHMSAPRGASGGGERKHK